MNCRAPLCTSTRDVLLWLKKPTWNEEVPVPDEYQDAFSRYAEQMTEAVAATDDALLEKYLSGDSIPREEVVPAMKKAMLAGEIVPLFCGSGELQHGVRALLTEMVELLPSPAERKPPWGVRSRLLVVSSGL